MRHLLFTHEYADGQFWYNRQSCVQDYIEHLEQGEIYEIITCLYDQYEITPQVLNGDTDWFQNVYEETMNRCITDYVYDGLYTDDEIEDFIIMDEIEG